VAKRWLNNPNKHKKISVLVLCVPFTTVSPINVFTFLSTMNLKKLDLRFSCSGRVILNGRKFRPEVGKTAAAAALLLLQPGEE
jgi:hypothetical protein